PCDRASRLGTPVPNTRRASRRHRRPGTGSVAAPVPWVLEFPASQHLPRLARPDPEPLPAEVDRDVAEGRVGLLDRPHQGPLAGGGLVAEQCNRAALASRAVDLPA